MGCLFCGYRASARLFGPLGRLCLESSEDLGGGGCERVDGALGAPSTTRSNLFHPVSECGLGNSGKRHSSSGSSPIRGSHQARSSLQATGMRERTGGIFGGSG